MVRPVAKCLGAFAVLAAVLVVAALIWTLSRPAPALPPVPSPNGFDDFVKAGQMFSSAVPYGTNQSRQVLDAFVRTNADALALARTGLSRDCRVVLVYSATNGVYLSDLASFKRLAQALVAEGNLAEMENRPGDAAESYSDTIRLGCEISRGGRLIESLVGIAIEAIGAAPLEKLTPALDAKHCREASAALETADSRRASEAAILDAEEFWGQRTYGWKYHILRLMTYQSQKPAFQRSSAKLASQQGRTRRLMLDLAARAYELEKGQRPSAIADLVPAYLKTIPQDPLTGTNMVFRP